MVKKRLPSSVKNSPRKKRTKMKEEADSTSIEEIVAEDDYEAIIIGAGPAGIGCATALLCGYMDTEKLLILEKGPSIGSSFREWHKFTRFISPSWPSSPYGPQDLNVIFPGASLNSAQHPTGDEYADYLEDQAKEFTMNIQYNHTVSKITHNEEAELFSVFTEGRDKPFHATVVIWCGGEWSYPREITCDVDKDTTVHYKSMNVDEIVESATSKSDSQETPVVVVGLGEAGADTACALAAKGLKVAIVDGNDPNAPPSKDPSCNLSPKSVDNLERYSEHIEVFEGKKCVSVKGTDKFEVTLSDVKSEETTTIETNSKVIMCTGFDVSQNPVIKDLFDWRDDGCPVLDETCDESTKTPNLFVCGPMIRHSVNSCSTDEEGKEKDECQTAVFCFVYKFRTRFAVVAQEVIGRVINHRYTKVNDKTGEEIITREGQVWGSAAMTMQEFYEKNQMYLSEITEACVSCG